MTIKSTSATTASEHVAQRTAPSPKPANQKLESTGSGSGFPLPNPNNPDLKQDLKELGEAEGDLLADRKLGDKDDIKRDKRNIQQITNEIGSDLGRP